MNPPTGRWKTGSSFQLGLELPSFVSQLPRCIVTAICTKIHQFLGCDLILGVAWYWSVEDLKRRRRTTIDCLTSVPVLKCGPCTYRQWKFKFRRTLPLVATLGSFTRQYVAQHRVGFAEAATTFCRHSNGFGPDYELSLAYFGEGCPLGRGCIFALTRAVWRPGLPASRPQAFQAERASTQAACSLSVFPPESPRQAA